MSDILNLNGTIEGLGGPFLGVTTFTRVLFVYYRKGTSYNEPTGEIDSKTGVQKFVTKKITTIGSIKETTPISKIETRFIRKHTNIEVQADGSLINKGKTKGGWLEDVVWLPIGIANSLTQISDDMIFKLLGDNWHLVPFSLKPIIVRQELREVAAFVTKNRRVLDDNDSALIKETAFYNTTKRNDTLRLKFETVKENVMLQLLLVYLQNWMNSQKGTQDFDSMVIDDSKITFPEYTGYPDNANQWDKSNDKYFIKRIYVKEGSPSYLFSYINDSMFLKRGKLSGYSVIPSPTGNKVELNISFESMVSEEEAFIYEKTKTNNTRNAKNTGSNGDLDILSNNSTGSTTAICTPTSTTTNGIKNPLISNPINMTTKGGVNMTPWVQ